MHNEHPAVRPPQLDEPRYALRGIPNTATGRRFIAMLKRHTNGPRFHVKVRANGPRVAAALADGVSPRAYRQSIPQRHAATFRVYFDDHQGREEYWREYHAKLRALDRAQDLEAQIAAYAERARDHARDALVARQMENETAATLERARAHLARARFAYVHAPALVRWIVRTFAPNLAPEQS
jgi:limonene-1,2-epoxide hydrolase